MSSTAAQILSQARVQLGDDKSPLRYGNPELFQYLKDGEQEITQKRPEALYKGDSIVTSLDQSTMTLASEVNIAKRYEPALVYYIAYRAMAVDGESEQNMALSQAYYAKFGGLLV